MTIKNIIKLDHLILRDLFDKYPEFEVEVKNVVIASAIKDRVKITTDVVAERGMEQATRKAMETFFEINYTNYKLKEPYASKLSATIKKTLEADVDIEVRKVSTELNKHFNEKLNELDRYYNEQIGLRIDQFMSEKGIPAIVEELVNKKLQGIYNSLAEKV